MSCVWSVLAVVSPPDNFDVLRTKYVEVIGWGYNNGYNTGQTTKMYFYRLSYTLPSKTIRRLLAISFQCMAALKAALIQKG